MNSAHTDHTFCPQCSPSAFPAAPLKLSLLLGCSLYIFCGQSLKPALSSHPRAFPPGCGPLFLASMSTLEESLVPSLSADRRRIRVHCTQDHTHPEHQTVPDSLPGAACGQAPLGALSSVEPSSAKIPDIPCPGRHSLAPESSRPAGVSQRNGSYTSWR